jgi:uncharacterized protein (UPF0297 family)
MPRARLNDPAQLRHWMKHRKTSCRGVADAVTLIATRQRAGFKCVHGTIGNLLSGSTTYVPAEKARLIEEVLEVPTGSLFAYQVSGVLGDRGWVT